MKFSQFLVAGAMLASVSTIAVVAQEAPVQGGTLVYLEQQPHTNLYPPAGGFYPNSVGPGPARAPGADGGDQYG